MKFAVDRRAIRRAINRRCFDGRLGRALALAAAPVAVAAVMAFELQARAHAGEPTEPPPQCPSGYQPQYNYFKGAWECWPQGPGYIGNGGGGGGA